MAKKERLDMLLVRLGHFESREQAQRAILAGWVRVAGAPSTKAGEQVDPDKGVTVERPGPAYVSRGAHKLERALDVFGLSVEGRVAMDVGASTGGFTDLMLKRGAARVFAVDVGYGQLAWSLRQDPRVAVFERTNVRHLTREGLGVDPEDAPELAVIDVSFIGLAKVLPAVRAILKEPGEIVALVKPQFEAGPEHVGKGGVVRDPRTHERVLHEVIAAAGALGLDLWGLTYSPIKGPEGNIEFLVHLRPGAPAMPPATVPEVVASAHRELVS